MPTHVYFSDARFIIQDYLKRARLLRPTAHYFGVIIYYSAVTIDDRK